VTPADALALAQSRRTVRRLSGPEGLLACYDETDRRLVAKGFPPTSPWWRDTFGRWYASRRRQLVVRGGRRGGKSSSLSRLAVVEALFGDHHVPPGDLGTVAIIAQNRVEGAKRLRTVTAILDALGVAYQPLGGSAVGVELVGRRIAVQVFAASIAGVSGFTGIFILADEVAKWLDADTGANPATEVLASVRPTMATQPNARIVLSSSPMGRLDAHYDAYELGETPHQVTAYAPTWVANPTITEEQTKADEPDEATWRREYLAEPQAEAESALLSSLLLGESVRADPWDLPPVAGWTYVATMDPATRGNAWTFVVATRKPDGTRTIALAREWVGTPSKPLHIGTVFAEMAALLRPYGEDLVYTDQLAIDPLREMADAHGLQLVEVPWTPISKREAYEELNRIVLSRQFECHPDPQVKTDLLGIRKLLTRAGVTYDLVTIGTRHSDYAPAVAMAVSQASMRLELAKPEPQPGTREFDAMLVEARRQAFLADKERPEWMPRVANDRGEGAWWRR
jgi:hypothetical protein